MQTLDFERADPPWVMLMGGWQETMDLWRTQGWDGRSLEAIFGYDRWLRVDTYYGPAPEFAYEVVEEDERSVTYINYEGILMRELKSARDTSMPQFLRFPVQNEEDFERLRKERLGLNRAVRFPQSWREQVAVSGVESRVSQDLYRDAPGSRTASQPDELFPRLCFADRWGGFFGPLRNLMGLENLCLALFDQPKLIERMMADRADMIIAITEEILKVTEFEVFAFWEDMAYRGGPLIGPAMFRKLALPHYRRVCDWLRSRGVKHIGLDSDGDIHTLIPIWLEAGIDFLWPFEVQSGMDVVAIRKTYGHDLAMLGGIDKRAVAAGGDTMRRAVDRVMPVVEDGGYIPTLDHSAPPDISWQKQLAFVEYLRFRLGRG